MDTFRPKRASQEYGGFCFSHAVRKPKISAKARATSSVNFYSYFDFFLDAPPLTAVLSLSPLNPRSAFE
jgi:hypothetical protein